MGDELFWRIRFVADLGALMGRIVDFAVSCSI
jgi:hypothetical protein